MDEKIIIFGLTCFVIGAVGLLTLLGILVAAMGVIPVCIYVCFLFIAIGINKEQIFVSRRKITLITTNIKDFIKG